jgi:hypothetical protein
MSSIQRQKAEMLAKEQEIQKRGWHGGICSTNIVEPEVVGGEAGPT